MLDRKAVGRCAIVASVDIAVEQVDEQVVALRNEHRLMLWLEIYENQQLRLPAEARGQLIVQVGDVGKLVSRRHGTHEKHGFIVRVDGLEAIKAAFVFRMTLRGSGVIVPKRVCIGPMSDHALRARHRLFGVEVKETVEVIAHEVQNSLNTSPNPIERKRFNIMSDLPE